MRKTSATRLADRHWLLILLALLPAAAGCRAESTAVAPSSDTSRVADRIDLEKLGVRRAVVVHYCRHDESYAGWNLWVWADGAGGAAHAFSEPSPDGMVYAVIPVHDDDAARLGFIVRRNEWEAKDVDRDRFIELPKEPGVAEVWLVSGDPRVYDAPSDVSLEPEAVAAFLDAGDAVSFAVTAKLTDAQRAAVSVKAGGERAFEVASVERKPEASGAGVVYTVRLAETVSADDLTHLSVSVPGLQTMPVFARDVLNEPRFTPLEAELGAAYAPNATTFRTWSPVADRVTVRVWSPDGKRLTYDLALEPREHGLWEVSAPGDLHGHRYRYAFESYGRRREVADIHAVAATPDSTYSIVLDLDRTDPNGWGTIPNPPRAHATDEVIYEVHVRDFTAHDRSVPDNLRGMYLGLIHENPGGDDQPATGLSHLQQLGVSAIHLLPIHDFGSDRHAYNWGYWTSLFNVPESSYSTDPDDPVTVSQELKTAIQGLHRADIRVILDVVYNHTSSSGERSPFEQTVPYYYFRTNDDGTLRNDAGVGNSIADERPMVRKYIVDSLEFWTREYRVDGFRFDLVGTHHPDTVRDLVETLHAIRPDVTLYGEPWTGGGPIQFGKGAQRGLDFAVFNDHLRGAVRGDLDGTATGFATGPGGDREALRRGVAGAIDDFTDEPTESVAYVSAHDNLTLWDKLVIANPDATDAQLRAQHKLALGVVLTSQGVAFLHGGSDYARTKQGEHNSYNLGDDVNAFDWARKAEYADVFEYVAGLVRLRRAHPAFRMHDDALVREHLKFVEVGEVVAYTIDGAAVGDPWSHIFVAYNGEPEEQVVPLPSGRWQVAVNAEHAVNKSQGAVSDAYEMPGYSMIVLFQP